MRFGSSYSSQLVRDGRTVELKHALVPRFLAQVSSPTRSMLPTLSAAAPCWSVISDFPPLRPLRTVSRIQLASFLKFHFGKLRLVQLEIGLTKIEVGRGIGHIELNGLAEV